MEKFDERNYSVEIPKLRYGQNTEAFEIDRSFFQAYEHSLVESGQVHVQAEITKTNTHIDAKLHFTGSLDVPCDRCMEPYPYAVDFEERMVFSYDEDLEFDTDEVLLIDRNQPVINLADDFYDFIMLRVPLRKIAEPDVHLCAPKVLELLGLNPDGSEPELEEPAEEESEEAVDPRWAALKNLKNTDEN